MPTILPYDRIVPTPYDNYDPGYSAEERRIATDHGIDLDAPEQVRCDFCFQSVDAEQINDAGKCYVCADECAYCNERRGSKKCCGLVEHRVGCASLQTEWESHMADTQGAIRDTGRPCDCGVESPTGSNRHIGQFVATSADIAKAIIRDAQVAR